MLKEETRTVKSPKRTKFLKVSDIKSNLYLTGEIKSIKKLSI
jgi:hypothetical protein